MESEARFHLKKEKNIVQIETPNAKYKIIYGIHELEQSPEVIKDSDGLIIEGVGNYTTPEKVKEFIEIIEKEPQRQKLIEYCRAHHKSLYLTDINEILLAYYKEANILHRLETVAGIFSSVWGLGDYIKEKFPKPASVGSDDNLSRRDFLKKIKTGAKTIAGAYLLMPELSNQLGHLIKQPDESSLSRKIDRALISANETVHPEIYDIMVTFRNYLIAQKAEYIAQLKKAQTQTIPELSILLGAGHSGIESVLKKSTAERIEFIKKQIKRNKFLKQPLITQVDFNQDEICATFIEEKNINAIGAKEKNTIK